MKSKKKLIIICLIIILVFILCFTFFIFNTKKEIKENSSEESLKSKNDNVYINVEKKGTYNNPTIPNGFKKVETDTASWNLNENGNPKGWNDGLVIEDEIGNQFVWVPVQNFNTFQKKEGFYEGQSQKILEYCTEADYFTNQTFESKELYESIEKYQGFYIARFEAGLEGPNKQDGTIRPVSKKGAVVWNNIRWGSAYGYALDEIQGDDRADGAVKVARSMYPNIDALEKYNLPPKIENSTNAISTLCYGVQWDIVMDFVKDIDNAYTSTKYIKDSTNMGWFAHTSHNQMQLAGTDIDDKSSNCVKNIYDLAGNVYEWTMEAYKEKFRIYRGGQYEMGDVKPSASMRAFCVPDGEDGNVFTGFRVTLYIK